MIAAVDRSAITLPGGDPIGASTAEWLAGIPTSPDALVPLRTALAWMMAGRTPITAPNRLWSVQARILTHQARRDEILAIRDVVAVLRGMRARGRS